jgi:hypothetical protein
LLDLDREKDDARYNSDISEQSECLREIKLIQLASLSLCASVHINR